MKALIMWQEISAKAFSSHNDNRAVVVIDKRNILAPIKNNFEECRYIKSCKYFQATYLFSKNVMTDMHGDYKVESSIVVHDDAFTKTKAVVEEVAMSVVNDEPDQRSNNVVLDYSRRALSLKHAGTNEYLPIVSRWSEDCILISQIPPTPEM